MKQRKLKVVEVDFAGGEMAAWPVKISGVAAATNWSMSIPGWDDSVRQGSPSPQPSPPGEGESSAAVEVRHRLVSRFSGGQCEIDLNWTKRHLHFGSTTTASFRRGEGESSAADEQLFRLVSSLAGGELSGRRSVDFWKMQRPGRAHSGGGAVHFQYPHSSSISNDGVRAGI